MSQRELNRQISKATGEDIATKQRAESEVFGNRRPAD